jgi:hypothetical protein
MTAKRRPMVEVAAGPFRGDKRMREALGQSQRLMGWSGRGQYKPFPVYPQNRTSCCRGDGQLRGQEQTHTPHYCLINDLM